MLAEMFISEPTGAGTEELETWRELRPLSPDFLRYWWESVEDAGTLMIDPDNTAFEQWSADDFEVQGLRTEDGVV